MSCLWYAVEHQRKVDVSSEFICNVPLYNSEGHVETAVIFTPHTYEDGKAVYWRRNIVSWGVQNQQIVNFFSRLKYVIGYLAFTTYHMYNEIFEELIHNYTNIWEYLRRVQACRKPPIRNGSFNTCDKYPSWVYTHLVEHIRVSDGTHSVST
jgi:hypothetical protein